MTFPSYLRESTLDNSCPEKNVFSGLHLCLQFNLLMARALLITGQKTLRVFNRVMSPDGGGYNSCSD